MVVHQPVPAVRAAGLLVGQEGEHQVARRRAALAAHLAHAWPAASRRSPSCRPRRGPTRSRRVTSPENGCTDPLGRRRPAPRRGGRARAARPARRRPAGVARVCGRRRWSGPGALSRITGSRPDLGQLGRDVLGGHPLARAGLVVAGVGGVDPDQVAAELDDLGFGSRRAGGAVAAGAAPARAAPARAVLAGSAPVRAAPIGASEFTARSYHPSSPGVRPRLSTGARLPLAHR